MYFRDFDGRYVMKPWYIRLRGLINIVFGAAAFYKPEWTAGLIIQLFGAWLIINNIIQVAPVFLGHRTRRLYPEIFGSSLVGFAIGIIAFTKDQVTVKIASVFVGLLLLFRAVIELSILVQAHLRVEHQKRLLLWVLISSVSGFDLLFNPISNLQVFEQVIGFYAIVIGLNHILTASRRGMMVLLAEEKVDSELQSGRPVPVIGFDELNLSPPTEDVSTGDWRNIVPEPRLMYQGISDPYC